MFNLNCVSFNFICGALGQNISFKPKNSKKITQAKLEHDLMEKSTGNHNLVHLERFDIH